MDFKCLKWFERNGEKKDKKAQAVGFDCCEYQHIADFSFALGDKKETHLFCHACKGHYFKGRSWTVAEWEEWINSPDEEKG